VYEPIRWVVEWHSDNQLDGKRSHFMWNGTMPYMFRTRREAREFINAEWGYIRDREDLRDEPHGWRIPRPVRVAVSFSPR
jgi:hypothetical protein